MLEFLAIIRHGTYVGPRLDANGERQMRALAALMLPLVPAKRVSILCSPLDRAAQSAALIAESFGVTPIQEELLLSHSERPPRLLEAYGLVERETVHGSSAVIVVTHLEYTEDLPRFVCEQLGLTSIKCPWRLEKGQGWFLDRVAQTAQVAP